MRYLLTIAAVLFATHALADEASDPIPAQNAPIKAAAPDPTIKVKNEKVAPLNVPIIKGAPHKTDFVMGDRKAPIVMIEYASLSCPHCAQFSTNVLPELEKRYISTGKVAYVLRQFPLNEPALRGAMLVTCVGESSEDKYFTFAKVLFDSQNKWAFDGNFLTGLETIATVGGLSRKQFQNCVNDKEREMRMLQAKKDANDQLKVPYTPYIIVDGVPYTDPPNAESLSKLFDAKLAQIKK